MTEDEKKANFTATSATPVFEGESDFVRIDHGHGYGFIYNRGDAATVAKTEIVQPPPEQELRTVTVPVLPADESADLLVDEFIAQRRATALHEQQQVNAGTQLVKLNQRVRELEQELKVMAEDRDDFASKLRWTRYHKRVCTYMDCMTADEMAVTSGFVDKLMGEGRDEYGPLDLSTDTRSVVDMLTDMADERYDSTFYAIMAKLAADREV